MLLVLAVKMFTAVTLITRNGTFLVLRLLKSVQFFYFVLVVF